MLCHDYEGVMLDLCTPLQVKCYRFVHNQEFHNVFEQFYSKFKHFVLDN